MNCFGIKVTQSSDHENLSKAVFVVDAEKQLKNRKEIHNNYVRALGRNDMGITGDGTRCKTCENTDKFKCFGHPGVFINMPMYCSIVCVKTIAKLASFVCHKCKIMKDSIKKDTLSLSLKSANTIGKIILAFDNFKINTSVGNCKNCVTPLLKYRVHNGLTIGTSDGKRGGIMTDLELAEFKRFLHGCVTLKSMFISPQLYTDFVNAMFMTTISILQPCMRKGTYSVVSQTEQMSYITMEYPYIFTCALDILSGEKENRDEMYLEYLTKIMNVMFGKDIRDDFPIGTKLTPLINLGGKKGDLREHLTSKVTASSGKETLCCDDTLRYNEMGITQNHAQSATRKEIVTHYNISRLKKIKDQSAVGHYPSIKKIIKKDAEITIFMKCFHEYELEVGDEIHRDLIDHDDILVLRQPAMMPSNNFWCIVRVYPSNDSKKTGIYFNSKTVAGFLRGDCDGDIIMLIYNTIAKGDLYVLMPAEANFKQFKNGGFDIFITNDPMAGLYNSTFELFPVSEIDLICHLNHLDVKHDRISTILDRFMKTPMTSADMVCSGFPDNFTYSYEKGLNETDRWGYPGFSVKNGRYVEGVITPDVFSSNEVVSIQKALDLNYGPAKTLEILHDITMLGQIGCNMTGVTINYGDYTMEEKFMRAANEYQQGAIEVANTYLNLSRTCPMASDDKKHKQGVTMAQKILSTGPLISAMVPYVKKGINNCVYRALVSKKGNPKIFGVSMGIGDFADLQLNLKNKKNIERGNHTTHYFPLTSEEIGYNVRTFFNGLTLNDLLKNLELARIAALGRGDGTRIPGTMARRLKNDCGSNQTGGRCVFYGTMADVPTMTMLYLPNCGAMPNKTSMIKSSTWISVPPSELIDEFAATPKLLETYTEIYNEAVMRHNNYKNKLWGECDGLDKEPIFIDFSLYQWTVKLAPPGDSGMKQLKALIKFIDMLPYITYGEDAYEDNLVLPDYCHQMVSIQILNFLMNMTPKNAVTIEAESFIDELNKIYNNIVGMLPPPNQAVGMLAVCALMEEATQMALDAPKNNMIADDAVYSIIDCLGTTYSPGDWVVFIVKVIEPHINWLEYIECSLEDLDPYVKVMSNAFDIIDYPLFEFNTKRTINYAVVCEFIIQQKIIIEKGYTLARFIAALINSEVPFYIDTINSVSVSVVMAFDAVSDVEITNSLVVGFMKSVIISKCIGIKDIQIDYSNVEMIARDGTMIKTPETYLHVTAKRLEVLDQIPGIDIYSVVCENPCAQSYFFGVPSSRVTMEHALRSKFKGHPSTNIAHLVSIAHITDRCVVLNNHFMNRIGTSKILENISAQGDSSKIFGAVRYEDCESSGIISSMITGVPPFSGTNSVIKVTSGVCDKKK